MLVLAELVNGFESCFCYRLVQKIERNLREHILKGFMFSDASLNFPSLSQQGAVLPSCCTSAASGVELSVLIFKTLIVVEAKNVLFVNVHVKGMFNYVA